MKIRSGLITEHRLRGGYLRLRFCNECSRKANKPQDSQTPTYRSSHYELRFLFVSWDWVGVTTGCRSQHSSAFIRGKSPHPFIEREPIEARLDEPTGEPKVGSDRSFRCFRIIHLEAFYPGRPGSRREGESSISSKKLYQGLPSCSQCLSISTADATITRFSARLAMKRLRTLCVVRGS